MGTLEASLSANCRVPLLDQDSRTTSVPEDSSLGTGNFFIMDSETLVSNALHESHQEAIGEVLKQNSTTEKLTSVKNNVCERHYAIAKTRLESQRIRRLKQLLDSSDMLRHEVKLMNLDRQRHSVEVKKRILPGRDFNYEDAQIRNKEKRLGVNIAPCYLDKKLTYSMRLRSASETNLTPTISKARSSLRMHDLQKSKDRNLYMCSSGVQRTKSTPISLAIRSTGPEPRGFTCAPISALSVPARNLRCKHSIHSATSHTNSLVDKHGRRNSGKDKQSHSKFSTSEHPLRNSSSELDSAKLVTKSYISYPTAARSFDENLEISDEDDKNLPEFINLRAYFYGDKNKTPHSQLSLDTSLYGVNQHLLVHRKAQCAPLKFSMDTMRAEADSVRVKVQKFMKDLSVIQNKKEQNKKDTVELYEIQQLTQTKSQTSNHRNDKTSIKPKTIEDQLNAGSFPSYIKSSTMPELTHQAISDGSTSVEAKKDIDNDKVGNNAAVNDTSYKKPQKIKYNWKFIKGRSADGQLRGTYTAEDLVLQALTGIPIRNVLQTPVPLHSATRAMRHTATFKIHKIVESLIKDRTRYQKHMVEELKRQMTEGLKGKTSAGDEPTPAEAEVPNG